MPDGPGELAIVLHTHMPYVEGFGTWPFGEEWLWEAIATCYLPLLDVLGRAPITLSLNISAIYVGVAIGSSLGAWALARWSVDSLGLVAGASEIVALVWLALTGALKPAPEAAQGQTSTDAVYLAAGE